jgi:RES domain-containing protein
LGELRGRRGRFLVSTLDPARLPASWRSFPAPADLQLLGDEWIASKSSAVLKVPSAIIETETNYLLNPLHSDFSGVVQADPRPFRFDVRLVQP